VETVSAGDTALVHNQMHLYDQVIAARRRPKTLFREGAFGSVSPDWEYGPIFLLLTPHIFGCILFFAIAVSGLASAKIDPIGAGFAATRYVTSIYAPTPGAARFIVCKFQG
jgi:hypothetical protein